MIGNYIQEGCTNTSSQNVGEQLILKDQEVEFSTLETGRRYMYRHKKKRAPLQEVLSFFVDHDIEII
mgnify:FL=1